MQELGQTPEAAAYAFYSGAPHAELWRLVHNYTTVTSSTGEVTWIPVDYVEHVRAALSVCIDALVYPHTRAMALLGRGAAWSDVAALTDDLRSAMRRV